MALLTPLTDDQRATFLVVSLPRQALQKLVGKLGATPRGTRLDTLSEWELADALVDYYHDDLEVAEAVDRQLRRTLGASPLAPAVGGADACQALCEFVLASPDPLRELAWALLGHGPVEAAPHAATLVQTIIAEYDEADDRARTEAPDAAESAPAPSPPDPEARSIEKEAARARTARTRALKRAQGMKEQLVDLEERLATARAELRSERDARADAERACEQTRTELGALRAQLADGPAAQLERLERAGAQAERRARALESELATARDAEAMLAAKLRALEQERPATGQTEDAGAADRPDGTATWSLPVFTDEFYESIRRWDRKVIRNSFEKIHRLADDWRHPSLRAIPLEGLPGHYRIRIASDVRLIYRPLDGGRVEIRSLIDREDLQRYIRTAKTRQNA